MMRIRKVFLGLTLSCLCSVFLHVFYVNVDEHRLLKNDVTSETTVQKPRSAEMTKTSKISFQESELEETISYFRNEVTKVAENEKHYEKNIKTAEQKQKTNFLSQSTRNRKMMQRYEFSVVNQTGTSMHSFVDFPEWYPPTLVDGFNINSNISRFIGLGTEEGKDPFVNLHQYSYSINSNICAEREMFLIMVIHSAPDNFVKRRVVRETHGSVPTYKGRHIGVVFMIGQTDSWITDERIKNESKHFGDIVQGNFGDNYKNLTKKHTMSMHWYHHYCQSDYILKLDDDTFVNLFKVVEYLFSIKPKGRTVHCYLVKGQGPLRKSKSKYYTPYSEYPFPIMPYFCKGFAYLTTPETWTAMLSASQTTRPLSMDDVYVTGMLAMRSGVHHFTIKHLLNFCDNETEMRDMLFIFSWRGPCGKSLQLYTKWLKLVANTKT